MMMIILILVTIFFPFSVRWKLTARSETVSTGVESLIACYLNSLRGSKASRTPSPMKISNDSMVPIMTKPVIPSHGAWRLALPWARIGCGPAFMSEPSFDLTISTYRPGCARKLETPRGPKRLAARQTNGADVCPSDPPVRYCGRTLDVDPREADER